MPQLGTQAPLVHVFGACVASHTTPQAPQFEAPCAVSQPFDVWLSQLKKPALQAPIEHVMLVLGTTLQVAAAFANEQFALQAPQFESVFTSCSQPLSSLLSQLAKPKLQPGLHLREPMAPVQLGVPFNVAQVWPQALQFEVELSCVSQSVVVCSQSSKSGAQLVATQLPVEQDSLELGKSQGVPHTAQFVRVVSEASQPLVLSRSQSS